MKFSVTLIFLFFLAAFSSRAQYTRFVVLLKDKQGNQYSLSNPSAFLSPKAIARRARQNIPIEETDLPITASYLDSIRNVPNVTVLNVSKWLNQVLIQTSDVSALTKINSFPFVKTTAAVAAIPRPGMPEPLNKRFKEVIVPLPDRSQISQANGDLKNQGTQILDYGNSFNQIHIHEGEYLHNLGFTGQGITIAILDAGFFGYLTNPAMDSVRLQGRILGTWDYVMNEASVNEDHPHGLYCFSIIAANKPGQIVGSAPEASFYLFRTEDAATEYPVEEQNWVAAAEYADSAGVDIISSSLGYSDFDDPSFNHVYAQRDGKTTIITRGANLAVRKGMIVTNSAGNSGNQANDYKYVICPADGDSVVAVGATNNSGVIASFSSWGPNGTGLLKPNVVSVGQGTILANTAGNAVAGNGTSFSNPNICGLIACLWEAFPDFTNMEIIDAVQKSADRYNNPDGRYGYGLPNFRKAYEALAKERELRRIGNILGMQWIKVYPVPYQTSFNVALKAQSTGLASFQIIDISGQVVETRNVSLQKDELYLFNFYSAALLARGVYFIRFNDGTHRETLKIIKQ